MNQTTNNDTLERQEELPYLIWHEELDAWEKAILERLPIKRLVDKAYMSGFKEGIKSASEVLEIVRTGIKKEANALEEIV